MLEVSNTQRIKDRARVGRLMNRPLKTTEEIHHAGKELVVCEDHAYHGLLHQRTNAIRACGHANWRICRYCKNYDSPSNLTIQKQFRSGDQVYHRECKRRYIQKYRENKCGHSLSRRIVL